ncbi:hypothetical protein BH09PSE5_BH09PSE5_25700 [soil metagenome]
MQATTKDIATATATPLRQLPLRLHHRAIVVRDMEATRHFMEDILGLPLVAAWCETTPMMDSDKPIDYVHAFFALADGSAIAFFQFADKGYEARAIRTDHPEIERFDHLALKSTRATVDEVIERATKWNIPYRITNHGYCKSVYVTSPDGMYLEFAEDPPYADEIERTARENAHANLSRWLAGDHQTTNNPYRERDF